MSSIVGQTSRSIVGIRRQSNPIIPSEPASLITVRYTSADLVIKQIPVNSIGELTIVKAAGTTHSIPVVRVLS